MCGGNWLVGALFAVLFVNKKEIERMKRINIALVLAAMASAQVQAQTDDMYFVPKKEKKVPRVVATMPGDDMREAPAYYVGSSRSVDEYNRRGRLHSSYTSIAPADSSMADVIDFEAGNGVYPDTLGLDSTVVAQSGKRSRRYDAADDDDYRYCRRMQMFDGWYGGPWGYYYDSFYGPYWGAAWGGWYDPWLYGYAGWYGPWRYGYYGWGWPYYSPYYSAYYWGGWGWPGYWGYPAVAVRRGGHTGTLQYYDRSNYAGGVRRPSGSSRGTYNRDNGFRDNGNNTYVGVGRRSSSRGFDNSSTFGNTPRYSQPSAPSFGGGSRGGSFGGGSFGGGGRGAGIGGGGVRMGRR